MSFSIQKFYEELDHFYELHDNEKTREFLQSSIERTRSLHDVSILPVSCPSCVETPTVNIEYVTVCNETACFLRGLSEWEKSVFYFDEALHELELFYLKNSPDYATILLNKAGTLRLMGNFSASMEAFQKAENYFQNAETPNAYMLASINNNLSLLYQDLDQLDEAINCTLKALSYLPDSPDMVVERGTTYNNLAAIYARKNDTEHALQAIRESLSLLKDQDSGMNAHYPAALNTYASLLFHEEDYEQALSVFKEALEMTQLIYGKNTDYVNCCLNIAATYEKLADTQNAESFKNEAADVKSQLR
jgi:tetratricopeptide (TPR) repeat protein